MRLNVQRVTLIESFKKTDGRLGCEVAACDSPHDNTNFVSAPPLQQKFEQVVDDTKVLGVHTFHARGGAQAMAHSCLLRAPPPNDRKARASGARGRRFDPCRARHNKIRYLAENYFPESSEAAIVATRGDPL